MTCDGYFLCTPNRSAAWLRVSALSEPAAEPGRPSTERRDSRNEPPPAAEDPRPPDRCFRRQPDLGACLRAGQSYPDFLQQELDRKGYAYQVRNEGISGDTTSAGLLRAGIVARSNAEFVIVAFGATTASAASRRPV